MYEQDYILRLAKQIAAVLARVLGLGRSGQIEEALAEIESAHGDLFGLPRGLIDVIPAAELARILGDPQKVSMLAQLLETEAVLLTRQGRMSDADRRRALARDLRSATARR